MLDGARRIYDQVDLKRIIEAKIKRVMAKIGAEKAAKMAAKAWMKLVPGLNIISTIADVADLVLTGAELIKMVREWKGISDKAVKVKPDFAIEGSKGEVKQVYDFKFDKPRIGNDPPFQDDWQKGQKQYEAYVAATGKKPIKVDNDTCKCGSKPK